MKRFVGGIVLLCLSGLGIVGTLVGAYSTASQNPFAIGGLVNDFVVYVAMGVGGYLLLHFGRAYLQAKQAVEERALQMMRGGKAISPVAIAQATALPESQVRRLLKMAQDEGGVPASATIE